MAYPSYSLLQTDPTTWDNPPADHTYLGVNLAGKLVTKIRDGTPVIVASGPSLNKQTNSTGTPIEVTPASVVHKEVITLTGAARTQVVDIAATSLDDGAGAVILFNLPATSGILVQVTSNSVLLWSFQNQQGAALNASIEVYKDGAGWSMLRSIIPSF